MLLKSVTVLLLLEIVLAAKLPPNLTKCKRKDLVCLKAAIQDALPKFAKGIRSMNLPGIDPLIIPKMEIPGTQGVVKMSQTYTDGEVIGLSKLIINYLDFNLDTNIIHWKFTIPKLVFKSKYEMQGQVLVFPVKGNGPMEIILDGISGSETVQFERSKMSDGDYLKVINSTLVQDAQKVTFNFQNLFNGNEELGNQINQVLNENWKEVFNEMNGQFTEGFNAYTNNIVNKFFQQVPLQEIFLD